MMISYRWKILIYQMSKGFKAVVKIKIRIIVYNIFAINWYLLLKIQL